MTIGLLSEAEKMRRVPGMVFADGTSGRVPRIAGTGLEVFEIIKVCQAAHGDRDLLQRSFDWLTPAQIDVALAYYRDFPDEVDARIEKDEQVQVYDANA